MPFVLQIGLGWRKLKQRIRYGPEQATEAMLWCISRIVHSVRTLNFHMTIWSRHHFKGTLANTTILNTNIKPLYGRFLIVLGNHTPENIVLPLKLSRLVSISAQ